MTFLLLLILVQVARAQDVEQVKQVLEQQRLAWNRGDLEAYMKGYWNNEALLFVGKNGPRYGWRQTLENYRTSYPDKEAMGILTFDIREVRLIADDHAFVLGAWHLKRAKDEPEGFFTLLVRKIEGEWLVVADHSS
ncbi:MAG: hypothetical protein RI924_311 [Bacteroidota bacterium]